MPSIEMPAMISNLSEVSRLHKLLELPDYPKNERRASECYWSPLQIKKLPPLAHVRKTNPPLCCYLQSLSMYRWQKTTDMESGKNIKLSCKNMEPQVVLQMQLTLEFKCPPIITSGILACQIPDEKGQKAPKRL